MKHVTIHRAHHLYAWAALFFACILALSLTALTGCSSSGETLESYVAENEEVSDEIEEYLGDDENLTVAFSGNTLEVGYILDVDTDDSLYDTYVEAIEDTAEGQSLASTMGTYAASLEEETGIEGISIAVAYYASDGETVMWSGEFSASDVEDTSDEDESTSEDEE